MSDLKEEAERLTPSSSVLDSSAMATRGTMLARIGVSIATTMVVLLTIA